MKNMIAVDGGGTKTFTVVFQEDGHIVYLRRDSGSNPLDIGEAESKRILRNAFDEAVHHANADLGAIYAGVAGLLYYDQYFEEDIAKKYGAESFKIEPDARNLISSELINGEEGCCLIVGTGCGTWVRIKKLEDIFHIGGWGYLVDTLGSGYSLGREVVRAVCMADDGRGEKTVLTELLEEETKGHLLQVMPSLYAGGRARFASLAHLAFEGHQLGDHVCTNILETGAQRLSELIWVADKNFDESYPVVCGGGIVTAYPDYLERIRLKSPKRAKLTLATRPPIFGAAVEAMHRSGFEIDESFKTTFMADFNRMKDGV